MVINIQDTQIDLALAAMLYNKKISFRKAALIFNIPLYILLNRSRGVTSRSIIAMSQYKLDPSKEQVIIQYILNLNTQGFSPTIYEVGDMANLLLRKYNTLSIGPTWIRRFVNWQPELATYIYCAYNYQQALCKDPDVLNI